MSSYIGAVDINSGEQILIGSTLYGICSTPIDTAAKKVVLPSFDALIQGITVVVKFVNGNTVSSDITLQFFPDNNDGSTALVNSVAVTGSCICEANGILAFTYEEVGANKYWRVNNSINITEGSTNGTINVNGQEISIHGLGTAAYTDSSAYATSNHNHDSVYAPINNPTFTGTVTLPGTPSSTLEAATKGYVDSKTAGLDGLSSAMLFKGIVDSTIQNNVVTNGGTESPYLTDGTQLTTKNAGDVVLFGQQEYVWAGTSWQLFGDEGSYALKTSTATASKINSFTQNTLPSLTLDGDTIAANQKLVTSVTVIDSNTDAASLTTNDYTIPNVTAAGTAMIASVSQGILTLTPGTNTQLGTAFSVKSVNQLTTQKMPTITVADSVVAWNAGTQASLSKDDLTVVVPNNSNNNNN